ncbi:MULTISPECIES: segregation and condensation protein A [unclassified Streptomyces]|uniref:segregation and condensation protein A n=1 Tax=unclassified Streptomyces TaxID=2593676 RepID=UPI002252C7FB|nr:MULTISPECIES: segregation/condensation protein A [unclassified Streptomyces]MCX5047147.1 segregation/condensation protein A [Streptomyces sp. NBC_00474]
MTSNDVPAPGASAGRRRALGRGPAAGAPRVEPTAPPAMDPPVADPRAPTEAQAEQAETVVPEPVLGPTTPVAPVPEAVLEPEAVAPESLHVPQAAVPEGFVESGVGVGAPAAGGASEEAFRDPDEAGDGVFKVRLANFEGPFDLLLQLISKHKLDVTEVALSKVTDEFMAHIRAMGPDWDLDQTTEFLVVAATLLDLKAARLLPSAEVEDEADLALLEARDLLFARLLQYRAYKQIADIFNRRLDEEARRYPRTVGLEPHHAELLPEVVISIGAEGFAKLAVKAMQPKPKPQVYVDHIHAPLVSVQEQAGIVVARLRELGRASFRVLVEDTEDTLTVVARFLALLELYREKAVALDQETALGELFVRWTGGDGDETPRVTDEFDRPPEEPKGGKDGKGDTDGQDGKGEGEEEKA